MKFEEGLVDTSEFLGAKVPPVNSAADIAFSVECECPDRIEESTIR
jgi:hypothetical protein